MSPDEQAAAAAEQAKLDAAQRDPKQPLQVLREMIPLTDPNLFVRMDALLQQVHRLAIVDGWSLVAYTETPVQGFMRCVAVLVKDPSPIAIPVIRQPLRDLRRDS